MQQPPGGTAGREAAGVFISVEGGEGVGKSLFIKNLAQLLTAAGHTVRTTREPGGTPCAERLRDLFNVPPGGDPLTPEAELFIISAARAQHVRHVILPALAAGQWVLCDRFSDSTMAYQGLLGGLPTTLLEPVIAASTFGLKPAMTFLLDCDPAVAQSRLQKRQVAPSSPDDGAQRYDGAAPTFHEELRQAFCKLAGQDPHRIVTLDAAMPPHAVAAAALTRLQERFQFAARQKTTKP